MNLSNILQQITTRLAFIDLKRRKRTFPFRIVTHVVANYNQQATIDNIQRLLNKANEEIIQLMIQYIIKKLEMD